jgi:hypothetical protein
MSWNSNAYYLVSMNETVHVSRTIFNFHTQATSYSRTFNFAQNLVISIQSATWRLQVRSQGVEILTLIKGNQRKKI